VDVALLARHERQRDRPAAPRRLDPAEAEAQRDAVPVLRLVKAAPSQLDRLALAHRLGKDARLVPRPARPAGGVSRHPRREPAGRRAAGELR
jgi:hypothetical protein